MKARAILSVALVAMALIVFVKFHFIKYEGGGGYVLWKDDNAYLFMYDRPFGYRLSAMSYILEPVKEYFYAPALPAVDKWNLSIIRITPAGVERHDQESAVDIDDFTAIDGEIYADCPGGVCKLTNGRFQLISGQEEQKMGGEGRLSKGEFAAVDGWSKRAINRARTGDDSGHYEFTINLGEGTKLVMRGGIPFQSTFFALITHPRESGTTNSALGESAPKSIISSFPGESKEHISIIGKWQASHLLWRDQ